MLEKKSNILTRHLPKTRQVVTYRSHDDGSRQKGWWRGLDEADNKTRFVTKTINGDVVVVDRATGCMWAADGNAAGCNNGDDRQWDFNIDYARNLDFAGFSDWLLPNINELLSIIHYAKVAPIVDETFFPNTVSDNYVSSTTHFGFTDNVWIVGFGTGVLVADAKSNSHYIRCVRGIL